MGVQQRGRLSSGSMGRLPLAELWAAAERDGVWALVSHEVCHLLVEECGWTSEQYEVWVEATLERVIPRS